MKASEAEKLRSLSEAPSFAAEALTHVPDHGGHHGLVSMREAEHANRKIVIKTSYEVTVDGRPLDTHVFVTNDGKLHSHALPNYVFASAVDLVKHIIDTFPDDFPIGGDHDHGSHTHEHS